MSATLRIVHGDRAWTTEVEGNRVRFVDLDLAFQVEEAGDGRFAVAGPSASGELIAAAVDDVVWVGVEGRALAFRVRMRGEERARSTARDEDALMPPMAATVARVQARPGDRVEAGDTLIVLEAMKMELPIRAPRPARVRAIHCVEGQLVQPGTLLVELDDDDPMTR